MKKIGAIFTLAALVLVMSISVCFADSGQLVLNDSYPRDGSTGASIENLGVKLYFDGDMSEEKAGKTNDGVFQLYDSEGKDGEQVPNMPKPTSSVIEVIVSKNRHGPTETVKLGWNSEFTLFTTLAENFGE